MKRFQATVYFLLLSIILFCMSSACLADDTADKFEISTSTDKQVYNESDTISIVVKIQNISPDKRVLEHKFEKDDSLLGLGVYIKGTGKLHIFPDDLDLKSTITINSGETIDIKYELPAYRVVLYSDYAEEVEFDIQGPWLKDASIEKTDLVISTNYKEASPPVSGPISINDLFLNNDIRIGNSLVKATDEHLLYLSNIPLAVEFAEKTKDFDGLIFNHVYITGGDYYSELFVILCSRTSDIEALVLRTWPDEGIKSSCLNPSGLNIKKARRQKMRRTGSGLNIKLRQILDIPVYMIIGPMRCCLRHQVSGWGEGHWFTQRRC